ncbi:MAG: hypothetical protein ACREI4_07180, partial [Candidatus Rokuibacteriota bacterium]
MGPSWFRGALVAALLAGVAAPAAAQDRLDRFRTVARERLAVAVGGAERERAVDELYEVVDAEVLDSLRADGPFSSPVFIRERLRTMMEAWGGASLRVLRIPGAGRRVPLTLGLYSLTGVEGPGSLRVYAGTGPAAALAASSTQDGWLDAHVWPGGPDGVARVLALWSGPSAAHGVSALRAELWEGRERDRVQRVWSTGTQWPEGLPASEWRTRPGELVVRYEPRYPGWKPGCAGQLEYEDRYRLAAAGGLVLAGRQVSNGWRRELGGAADRFFRALADGDARALEQLVPASG